jgi:hypothetical protein
MLFYGVCFYQKTCYTAPFSLFLSESKCHSHPSVSCFLGAVPCTTAKKKCLFVGLLSWPAFYSYYWIKRQYSSIGSAALHCLASLMVTVLRRRVVYHTPHSETGERWVLWVLTATAPQRVETARAPQIPSGLPRPWTWPFSGQDAMYRAHDAFARSSVLLIFNLDHIKYSDVKYRN